LRRGCLYLLNLRYGVGSVAMMTPDHLKDARQALGMSQNDLAVFLGLSRSQIIRYETGFSEIPNPVAILVDIMTDKMTVRKLRSKIKR
jgi:predicted transcriptional regulator